MSDPLRTDAARPADPLSDADREARIEQLLLSGLDEYFAGHYDQAINIWTRVVFLERGHSRARAYIERARGALAERHRESEELLDRGVAAFNSGDTDAARDLITQAVAQGGPQDVALVVLDRLNRLAAPASPVQLPRLEPGEPRVAPPPVVSDVVHTPSRWMQVAAVLALLVGGLALAVVTGVLPDWVSDPGEPAGQVISPPADPLPVARSSELVLDRAKTLRSGGHLHDALRALESIGIADPLRKEADVLRGELQRRLLDASRTPSAGPARASEGRR